MRLQCQIAFGESVLRIDVIVHNNFAIHFDGDVVSYHSNVLRKPYVVIHQMVHHILEVVKAARALGVSVRIVHLRFVPLGKSHHKFRTEVHSGIGSLRGFCFCFKLAIHTFFRHPEQMAPRTLCHNRAIFHFPVFRNFRGLPSFQVFSIKHFYPFTVFCFHCRKHRQTKDEY